MYPILHIDGILQNYKSFVVPEMSLSSSRGNMKRHSFEIQLSSQSIIELMSEEYQQWVKESKEDDKQMGSPQDELAIAGYPSIENLLANEGLTQLVFGEYLIRELLEKCTWDKKSEINFWFDSCKKTALNGSEITFHGICYSKD